MATTLSSPILSVRNLTIDYKAKRGFVHAIRDVSFDIEQGKLLALIGESGSGKTTFGAAIMRLLPPQAIVRSGQILYRGKDGREIDVLKLSPAKLRTFRWQECAMVFQNAQSTLNPMLRIASHFEDTAKAHAYIQGDALKQRAWQLLDLVRLDPERVWRSYPHELSGGMKQRVAIALALLLEPQLLILDEPTTALDILNQRSVMDVLKALRQRLDFSLVFISHDLSLAAELADDVATAYAGRVVEMGAVAGMFKSPHHPYTVGLFNAIPTLTGHRDDLTSIPGSPPDLINLPSGCKFHPRCPIATAVCKIDDPRLEQVMPGRWVACWHWQQAASVKAQLEVRD